MAESKVNRDNYIVIQGWMVADLKLKGNELLIYAILYGFTQAENQIFSGSLQYLADWTNSTKQGVMKCLKQLEQKGLIVKKDTYINNVKFCEYYTTKFNRVLNKVEQGMQQSLTGGMQQSLTNNKDLNNLEEKKEERKKERKNSFDTLIDEYCNSLPLDKVEKVKGLLQEWLKVRKSKRAAMTDKSIELNLKKLTSLAEKSKMAVDDYLEEVIRRGWQAFFEIKDYNNNQGQQQDDGDNVFLSIAKEANIF